MILAEAERYVGEYQQLTRKDWVKLDRHPLRDSFLREYLRAKCMTDLWWFMKFGVYANSMQHYYEPLHGPRGLSGFLQDWTVERNGQRAVTNTKCVFMARETCKTQQAGIAYILWRLVRDPAERILIRAFTDAKAKEILAPITATIANQKGWFRELFPWVHPKTHANGKTVLWKDDVARIDAGPNDMVRTPSLQCCGYDVEVTGGHMGFGYYDDFEVDMSANSAACRPRMIERWKSDNNLFMGGSQRMLVGTPWRKDALINPIMNRLGEFKDHAYSVFVMPAEVRVLESTHDGQEPILLEDRVTLRCSAAQFPTADSGLELCQATVTFFSAAARDTVVEIREVVWNDSTHFRVNRPFPELLGQPLAYRIGREKPCAPNRFTMDSEDTVAPGPDTIARKSLYQARIDQGSRVYTHQMLLKCADTERQLFNIDNVKRIALEDLPAEGTRFWYRACDLATKKTDTSAKTAITTGFWHKQGFFITHIYYGNYRMTDTLLELFLGVLRINHAGGSLRATTFENTSRLEDALLDLHTVMKNGPYEYFRALGGHYREIAESTLKEIPGINIRNVTITRHKTSKGQRFAGVQPIVERGKLHIVRGIRYEEDFFEQMGEATMATDEGCDIVDNVTDLLTECAAPNEEHKPKAKSWWNEDQAQLMFKSRTSRSMAGIGWRP